MRIGIDHRLGEDGGFGVLDRTNLNVAEGIKSHWGGVQKMGPSVEEADTESVDSTLEEF